MNWEMLVPIYGTYHSIDEITTDHEEGKISFGEAAFAASVAGATTASVGAAYSQAIGYNVMTASAAYRNYQITVGAVRVAPLALPFVALATANQAVIESAPEEEQRGLWLMFSSALTGTFGGDYSGLV